MTAASAPTTKVDTPVATTPEILTPGESTSKVSEPISRPTETLTPQSADASNPQDQSPVQKATLGLSGIKLTPTIADPVNVTATLKKQYKTYVALTQELLETLWNQYYEAHTANPKVASFMPNRKLVLVDQNQFNIVVPSLIMENDYRDFQVDLLEFLRYETGHANLKSRVIQEIDKQAAKPYRAADKYQAMLEKNPELSYLHSIFTDLDL